MGNDNTLKAVVRGGRITLDDPTDLPEGEVIELVPADPYAHLDDTDDMDDEERARLHASLERGVQQMKAGKGRPAQELIEALLRKR